MEKSGFSLLFLMFNALEVSQKGLHLAVSSNRLVVSNEAETVSSIPLTELDALIIADPAVSVSGVLISQLAAARIPVIFCDRKYLPAGILCPFLQECGEFHSLLPVQFLCRVQWKAKIWKKLIVSKIQGQHHNLLSHNIPSPLKNMAKRVQNGDSHNVEAHAASAYWTSLNLFPARDRSAQNANILFNYVYAILYAAVARALCAAAFHPHIGIHHHGKYNPFSLASDLMEPFRPFADRAVFAFLKNYPGEWALPKERRMALCRELYSVPVKWNGKTTTMLEVIPDFVQSYKKCLITQKTGALMLPKEV